jgi:hypothetical protein
MTQSGHFKLPLMFVRCVRKAENARLRYAGTAVSWRTRFLILRGVDALMGNVM